MRGFSKKKKKKKSYANCRAEGPGSVYWVVGLVLEHVGFNREVQINGLWNDSSHEDLGR